MATKRFPTKGLSERRAGAYLLPAVQQLSEGLAVFDASNRLLLCNQAFRGFYPKLSELLIPGTSFEQLVQAADERQQILAAENDPRAPGVPPWPISSDAQTTIEHRTSEGRWIAARYGEVRAGAWMIAGQDVTDVKALQRALQRGQDDFERLVINNPYGVLITDFAGAVQFSNLAAQKMLGRGAQELEGEPLGLRLAADTTSDVHIILPSETDPHSFELSVVKIEWQGTPSYLAMLRDVTNRKQNERQIEHFAYHDPLTGLPNRRLFYDRLKHALARAQRDKHIVAILFMDLDRFKKINDELGHDTGDQLLQLVAVRLRECLRDMDTVARFGGDEFVALLEQISQVNAVGELAERIRSALNRPFLLAEHTLQISVSIGVSLYPADSTNPEVLIRYADSAMYKAKQEGRNNVNFYST